jgi:hypothetical protein
MEISIENIEGRIHALSVPLDRKRLMAAVDIALDLQSQVRQGIITPRQENFYRRQLNTALGSPEFVVETIY